MIASGCFFVDSYLFIKWYANDDFINNVEPERNRWRKGRTVSVGGLDHKMKIVAWNPPGARGSFTRRKQLEETHKAPNLGIPWEETRVRDHGEQMDEYRKHLTEQVW